MSEADSEASFATSESLGSTEAIAASRLVLMKFGGSSVASAENWITIAGLIRNRLADGLLPVIVHSALYKVSDRLEAALDTAATGAESDAIATLREQHYALAQGLDLDPAPLLDEHLDELEQLLAGIRLIREVSVRVRVRVLALGELMATRLGAAYLQSVGIDLDWLDARDLLTSQNLSGGHRPQDYLSATCDTEPDAALQRSIQASGKVVLTQGFIARNEWGETVLLGRGGSDTSAAYFAARLQARRLEIWTDVPGMFTADPRVVPSARLLLSLHYDEAQELASAGSSVLHPRCLSPLRADGIPLFIRCTRAPAISGTVISSVTDEVEPQVKGICLRDGLTLISMDGVRMWQEVGFLARVFAIFAQRGVSVDLVSTSETNVTVSIDTADGGLTQEAQRALVTDLEAHCRVRTLRDCSAVSLVGRKIRTILPRISSALEVFEEEKVHLMSQAANDLNLSFVISQGQGPKLVRKLHASVIRKTGGSQAFGKSWEQLFHAETARVQAHDAWWIQKRDALLAIAEQSPNAYVYDRDTVRQAARDLKGLRSVGRVLYAVKANFNAELIRVLDAEGVDFETVSPGEVAWLQEVLPDLDLSRILFTPNFAPRDEYAWGLEQGLQVTLDNLHPLQAWPELFKGQSIFVRIDPGQGRGHHEHVKTAGVHSKFGIPRFEMEELERLVAAAGATVTGIHAHSGSGILDPDNWRAVAVELLEVAKRFPEVRSIDLGGGLGVPEKPGDKAFDLAALDDILEKIRDTFPDYELWLEPGRFLVAPAGVLLTRVTQLKGKGDMRYVGVGTGMNSLIRPALYGAYHEIVNLTRVDEMPTETVTIVGPICETGDKLGTDRLLPPSAEGDVILIANTGAYGYVMSSHYNRREIAPEHLL